MAEEQESPEQRAALGHTQTGHAGPLCGSGKREAAPTSLRTQLLRGTGHGVWAAAAQAEGAGTPA